MKTISRSGLARALKSHGVESGSILVLEAPHLEPAEIEGNYSGILASVQEVLGIQGTLVVPTCSPAEGAPKPTFDPDLSPSEMGAFSEFFRQEPGARRSHNPTHSVAALGPEAENLLSGHRSARGRPSPWGDGPFGFGSPWDRLYEAGAWWVLIDARFDLSPFVDYVRAVFSERHAGLTRKMPFPIFNADLLRNRLQERGMLREGKIGGRTGCFFRLRPAFDTALEILEEDLEELEPAPDVQRWLVQVARIRQEGRLFAGAVRVAITPPVPCRRWEGKLLTGVARDLYARTLVASFSGQEIALVLFDLLGLARPLVQRLRKRIKDLTGIAPEAVMVACTHAHSSPDTVGAGYEDPSYLDFLIETTAQGVAAAYAARRPARLGWGKTSIRGLAHSRRKRMKDGRVFTTRYGVPSTWHVDPQLLAGENPIDPELTVMRIEDLDGNLLAALSNFGCHASVALMSSQLSGDFPGEAMAALETLYGDPVVVLCTNGAAADVDPTAEMPYWGPRDDANARRLGRIFAAQVLETLERIQVEEVSPLATICEPVTLEVRPEWFHLLEKDPQRMQQEFARGWSLSPAVRQILQERCIQTEVQAVRMGSLVLVGFPGEIFAETGLALKAQFPEIPAAVLELTNDDIGYIPPRGAFSEGGYETAQNLWGRTCPGAAEILLKTAGRALQQVFPADIAVTSKEIAP